MGSTAPFLMDMVSFISHGSRSVPDHGNTGCRVSGRVSRANSS